MNSVIALYCYYDSVKVFADMKMVGNKVERISSIIQSSGKSHSGASFL